MRIFLYTTLAGILGVAPVHAQFRLPLFGRSPCLPNPVRPSYACPQPIRMPALDQATASVQAQPDMQWGSLSGKILNEKTRKPLADAIVYLRAPDVALPIHPDDKKPAKDLVVRLPAGMLFDFRTLTHYVSRTDDEQKSSAGRKLTIVGDAVQDHVVRIDWMAKLATNEKAEQGTQKRLRSGNPDPNDFGGRAYIAAGSEASFEMKLNAGYLVQSETYRELKAHILVFDHPYFAFTKTDGSFTMPRVPVGEWMLSAWHEDVGYALTTKRDATAGMKINLKAGKNVYEPKER